MLTLAQRQAVKAYIDADPILNAIPNTIDGAFAVAAELNKEAVPAFVVWRTDVPTKDVKKAIVWSEYIASSVGERDAFTLIISNGIVNAADANVRQGLATIFGSPQQATTRNQLLAIAKRPARVIEKILATGTGSDAVPATMAFEGAIGYQDVYDARNP